MITPIIKISPVYEPRLEIVTNQLTT